MRTALSTAYTAVKTVRFAPLGSDTWQNLASTIHPHYGGALTLSVDGSLLISGGSTGIRNAI